jgi:Raf kinase inhibitor-like YbhB/YbcL family protein
LKQHGTGLLASTLITLSAGLCTGPSMAQQGFELTSPAFKDGGYLEKKNVAKSDARRECGGDNISPPLAWHRAPSTTKSFAVLMLDPEAQFGSGLSHWVAYDMPPETESLAEGEGTTRFINGRNYRGFAGYWGPCPPVGDAPHHYVFMIMALDVAPGMLKPDLTRESFLGDVKGKAVGAAALVGLFAR